MQRQGCAARRPPSAETGTGYARFEPPAYRKAENVFTVQAKSILLRSIEDSTLKIERKSWTVYAKRVHGLFQFLDVSVPSKLRIEEDVLLKLAGTETRRAFFVKELANF